MGMRYVPTEIIANKTDEEGFGSSSISPVPGIPPSEDYGIFGAINVNNG
jgi:hypothetical protein